MFFGLTNSPSTFQEMMNVIYKEVIEKHAARGTIIRIYMDNIAIATSGTRQDHIDAVRDVLRVAEQHNLYFKLSKCTFHASSIDYLGVIIEKGMTRMDPVCHGSAGTPLGTHAGREALGLQDARTAIHT
jgi:hypothetical protein